MRFRPRARIGLGTVLVVSLVVSAMAIFLALPQAASPLVVSSDSGVRGAMHVHTRRSDGSGTPEQVAAAAAKAGLRFVVLTDHGDGTRTPARPAYHNGVLVIDAVEISAEDGHVIALGLPKSPYPLRGEVRDIVEDITRMGGMSIAAHPGSVKSGLRWTDWTTPFDGLEWLNGDSESRDERWTQIGRVLLTYPFRSAGSLGTLLDRPGAIFSRWDALTARRRVVAVAGADAHARLDVTGNDTTKGLAVLSVPGYASMFRTFSVTATGVTLRQDADADSAAILDAIRKGHLYSAVDVVATPAAVTFTASRGGTTWTAGDFVAPEGGDIELKVEHNGPMGSRIVLVKDGKQAAATTERPLRHRVSGTRGVYRAEIHAPGAPGDPPVPWVVTNPIYVRAQDETPFKRGDAAQTIALYENGAAPGWRIEKSPRAQAALDVVRTIGGTELLMRWAIGGTEAESPYAAFAMPAGNAVAAYDRLLFTARSEQPMRLSVQFRLANGERWRRSVYLDETARPVTVFFDDVRPAGTTSQRRLTPGQVRDVLFVVDTVNTSLGASGQFWIDDVRYGR